MAHSDASIDVPDFNSRFPCYNSYATLSLCSEVLAINDSAFTSFRKHYEINWTDLDTSTAEEMHLSRVCPALFTNDQAYKNIYWKSLLVKDIHGFNVIDGKVVKENSFDALKSSPNYVLGGFIPFFGFQRPAPQLASLSSSSSPDGTPIEKLYTK
ncbi:hypothetical protein G6F38_004184 [Rhizopus arrhizus]|nr:hypothetical protein G6F38_004184 [Rhizopus arrhizus]